MTADCGLPPVNDLKRSASGGGVEFRILHTPYFLQNQFIDPLSFPPCQAVGPRLFPQNLVLLKVDPQSVCLNLAQAQG